MMHDKGTPVLLLGFNRPDVTELVFAEIAKAQPKQLFFAVDGPRPEKEREVERCNAVRDLAKRVDWDCEFKTLFRDENLGCRKAVSSAITWFFEHVDRGIILEDDCLPSQSFFPFCGKLLDRYADDERVMMISGNNYQDGTVRGDASYYFSGLSHIWGWATWRRAWNQFDLEMSGVKDFSKPNLIHELFSDQNIAQSWNLAFAYTQTGRVSSWAYPWNYSILVRKGLSIVPNVNLVSNIGFGTLSTHTTDGDSDYANVKLEELDELKHPKGVISNDEADLFEYRKLYHCYPRLENMSLYYRFKRMRKARRLKIKIKAAYDAVK